MLSIKYHTLHDFTALPALRDLVARGDQGFFISNLPFAHDANVGKLHGFKLSKNEIQKSTFPSLSTAVAVMKSLHGCSHEILNNISHVFELPWEKYLSEMHEFAGPGTDELRAVPRGQPIPNKWSSLTIILPSNEPEMALVLFGTALSVFSEGMTAELKGSEIDSDILSKFPSPPDGDWIVYYVRPNEGVFYTRTAGALMTPLSQEEHDTRKRVKDMFTGQGLDV